MVRRNVLIALLVLALSAAGCAGIDRKPFPHELVVHDAPDDFRRGSVSGGAVRDVPPGVVLEPTASAGGGESDARGPVPPVYESPPVRAGHPFNEVLASWNVVTPPGTGFAVELRVGRGFDGSWSPWLHVGDWGYVPPGHEKTVTFVGGRIDVDYLRSDERWDRAQYRVRVFRDPEATEGLPGAVRIARVALCLSDRTGRPHSVPPPRSRPAPPAPRGPVSLPVPFRSQRGEGPELAARICSPTSVAMVLEYRGVDRPTADVAARLYDEAHDIYGNWPRAVQGAFTYGVPGYLARFSDWNVVRAVVAAGQPLIISIGVEKGQLTGAPYESTAGHLLVVTGFDGSGGVRVNDPAAEDASSGQTVYRMSELEEVWMRRGGTAYVLLPAVPE